jgi:hypothetical protein
MEVIKRKILLEESIDRTYNSPTWGTITATTFYINILLTQTMDDMGQFTDMVYIPKSDEITSQPDYTLLVDKLGDDGIIFPFMNGGTSNNMTGITGTNKLTLRMPDNVESDYYVSGNLQITGYTDSKLDDVKSYSATDPYRIGFDVSVESYVNYVGTGVIGVSRIKSMAEPRIYVFDTKDDANLGTNSQIYGLQYLEYTGLTRNVFYSEKNNIIPVTQFKYIGEGWNMTNVSLSALTKEEYLFGIISTPEVQSDVFIERGATSVMDMHLRLSEISDLAELSRYGNGYYKLNKQ